MRNFQNRLFYNPSFAPNMRERMFRRAQISYALSLLLYEDYRCIRFTDESGRSVGTEYKLPYGNHRDVLKFIEDELGHDLFLTFARDMRTLDDINRSGEARRR